MTNDGPISPVLPPNSANRLPRRELFALLLGRDVVPAPGDVATKALGQPGERCCRSRSSSSCSAS